jgi:heme exporter protein C
VQWPIFSSRIFGAVKVYPLKTYLPEWLKIVAVVVLAYVHIAGLLMDVPRLAILNETIRALYFHVPMWFGMVLLYALSVYHAVRYLRYQQALDDGWSESFAHTGTAFGILGVLTGMLWANYTWGAPWHGDPKQNGAGIALLIYLAYFVLRGSVNNREQRARLSAVYNVFAFASIIPLLFIIPRLTDSMHPGSGGNPGFNMYDLDSRMRWVFYPAVAAWFIIGWWMVTLRMRIKCLKEQLDERDHT